MNFKVSPIAFLVFGMSLPLQGAAQERIPYDQYQLQNGLTVILIEQHTVPIATVDIWYDVGSANERPGRSGFAHLFEHMMFQGSANVGKAEHMQFVERAGGSMNGTTNDDRTAYFETVPANRLNLALWLEADRMRSLAVTEENLANQTNAVQEERRMRIDNQPYAPAFVEGLTQMYDSVGCFAYAHSVIGSMEDLEAADTTDVQEFFKTYYAPNNATLTVVGDFDADYVKGLIEDYFGDIPAAAPPPEVSCEWSLGTEPEVLEWLDPHANLPLTLTAYRIGAHKEADTRPLQLLSNILGAGESSRLNQGMVRETQAALQAGTQFDSRRHAGMFAVFAVANQGVTGQELQDQLAQTVGRILEEGVTEEELTKAKNSFRSSDIFGRMTTMNIAESAQHYAHFHDSIEDMYMDLDLYMEVTADDIRRVARLYLTPENSFTILVLPEGMDSPVP